MIALRSAIRSKLVVTLLVVLLLTVVGLPMTVKGDGSLSGQLRIMLYYTLGLATMILSAATVWAACGAVSLEIADKSVQLVAVKPVRRFEIWLGKWLGLMLMNSVLLTCVGITTYVLVLVQMGREGLPGKEVETAGNEILTGRRLAFPHVEPLDREAKERLDQLYKAGRVPAGETREHAQEVVRQQLLMERSVVQAGASRKWQFDAPVKTSRNETILLRLRFYRMMMDWGRISGTWTVGPEDAPHAYTTHVGDFPGNAVKLSIPATAVPAGKRIIVEFRNDEKGKSSTVGFDPHTSVEMLITESSFGPNFVRALFVVFCYLALLAALGVTAGSLFSFPVAAFVSAAVLAISGLSDYFVRYSAPDSASAWQGWLINKLNLVITPSLDFTPLANLSDGLLVSWGMCFKAVLVLLVIYSGVLALLGGAALKARELALPELD
ncbi:MAG: hypothetical protein C0404_00015 [Verrucomicrobia bacterium]|nr:hypothetical protein [Verrucomicrobiota bacterium]